MPFRQILLRRIRQARAKVQKRRATLAAALAGSGGGKARFIVHPDDRKGLQGGIPNEVSVQFNPSGYGYQRTATWNEGSEGQKTKELQFDKLERRQVSVELMFDALSQGLTDVRPLVATLEAYARPVVSPSSTSERPRPPRVSFVWGGFAFTCVLSSVNVNFTLFSEKGVPVRAKVQVSMREYVNPAVTVKSNGAGDPESYHVVQHGETLMQISAEVLGDPSLWRAVAIENNIDNPMKLPVGLMLKIPAME